MRRGLMVLLSGSEELLLPIFHADRDIAFSVLKKALETCEKRRNADTENSVRYFDIANILMRKVTKSIGFIGPQPMWGESREEAFKNVSYAFKVDLVKQRIIPLDKAGLVPL